MPTNIDINFNVPGVKQYCIHITRQKNQQTDNQEVR